MAAKFAVTYGKPSEAPILSVSVPKFARWAGVFCFGLAFGAASVSIAVFAFLLYVFGSLVLMWKGAPDMDVRVIRAKR